jgi:purine-binding chemotaxis protein CheW
MSEAATITATQYLTFHLAEEMYALDVSKVREVLEVIPITAVPRTPVHMRGVINVRGSVVPVIDMRLRLGMPKTENTVDTCIIVTELAIEGQAGIIGVLADAVSEVIDLEAGQIEPPPRFGTRVRGELIKGIGKRNDAFIIILDIDRVLGSEELAEVQVAAEKHEQG